MPPGAGRLVPRPAPLQALLSRARGGAPLLLTGPPGAGKTTLLLQAAQALEAEGWLPIYLDLMGAVSTPERFVRSALSALPTAGMAPRLAQATAIRRLADAGRASGSAAVQALVSLWSSLDQAGGKPVALLLDEATEIRSLSYFAGLREVHRPFGAALAGRPRGTLLATSYPTLARRLWPALETLEAGPLEPAEVAPFLRQARLPAQAGALCRGSFGWPRYLGILVDRLALGEELGEAWAQEMAPGGRLEGACRHTHETLLLRSRGYGMSKAVLEAVAEEEGLNLTALVARLERTPGAVRDYLGWLLGVDALRMVKKRYYYVDGMVRTWVRLHGRGRPGERAQVEEAAREALGAPTEGEVAAAGEMAVTFHRPDTLMEID